MAMLTGKVDDVLDCVRTVCKLGTHNGHVCHLVIMSYFFILLNINITAVTLSLF